MTLYLKSKITQLFISNMWKSYMTKNVKSDVRHLHLCLFGLSLKEFNLKEFTERYVVLEVALLGIWVSFQLLVYKKINNVVKDKMVAMVLEDAPKEDLAAV